MVVKNFDRLRCAYFWMNWQPCASAHIGRSSTATRWRPLVDQHACSNVRAQLYRFSIGACRRTDCANRTHNRTKSNNGDAKSFLCCGRAHRTEAHMRESLYAGNGGEVLRPDTRGKGGVVGRPATSGGPFSPVADESRPSSDVSFELRISSIDGEPPPLALPPPPFLRGVTTSWCSSCVEVLHYQSGSRRGRTGPATVKQLGR